MDLADGALDPLARRSLEELITCILGAIVSAAVKERAEQIRLIRELGEELLEDLDRGRIFPVQLRGASPIQPPRTCPPSSTTGLCHERSVRS
jgi:hypothetical protein